MCRIYLTLAIVMQLNVMFHDHDYHTIIEITSKYGMFSPCLNLASIIKRNNLIFSIGQILYHKIHDFNRFI